MLVSRAAEGIAHDGTGHLARNKLEVAAGEVQLDQALPELARVEPRIVHLAVVRSCVHRQDVIPHFQGRFAVVPLNNQAVVVAHAVVNASLMARLASLEIWSAGTAPSTSLARATIGRI